MHAGIKIIEDIVGTGEEAVRGKVVIVNMRLFLPDGSELVNEYVSGQRMKIDLARRDCIAGIRYGIEGMRVGGRRNFIISSHLAYGAEGVQGKIPPYASLRCEVELIEVRNNDGMRPEDYPPGKKLVVFCRGELTCNKPRWTFWLGEDGDSSVSVTIPIQGQKWRHARKKHAQVKLDPTQAAVFFEYVLGLPKQFPNECFSKEVYTYGGDSGWFRRVGEREVPVGLNIAIWERGQYLLAYYIEEDSQCWLTSPLRQCIEELLKPFLV